MQLKEYMKGGDMQKKRISLSLQILKGIIFLILVFIPLCANSQKKGIRRVFKALSSSVEKSSVDKVILKQGSPSHLSGKQINQNIIEAARANQNSLRNYKNYPLLKEGSQGAEFEHDKKKIWFKPASKKRDDKIKEFGLWHVRRLTDESMNTNIRLEKPKANDVDGEYIIITPDNKYVHFLIGKGKMEVLYKGKLYEKLPPRMSIQNYLKRTFYGNNAENIQSQLSRSTEVDAIPPKIDEYNHLPEWDIIESINVFLKEIEKGVPTIRDYQDGNETKDVFRLRISPSEGIGTGFVKIENSRYDTEFQRAA